MIQQNQRGSPLPAEYWVKTPESKTDKDEFSKLTHDLQGKEGGMHHNSISAWYKYKKGMACADSSTVKPTDGLPIIDYQTWKAAILGTDIQDYSLSAIKGKKVAIHCPTQQDWNAVIVVMNREKYNPVGINSGSYSGNDSIGMATGGICPKSYYEKEGYQVITAEQFLQANPQPSVQSEYAVDSWIVPIVDVNVAEYALGRADREKGKAYKVNDVIEDSHGKYVGTEGSSSGYILCKDIRLATQDEIQKAQGMEKRPDEIPVDGWKVGDKLPEEWLKEQAVYTGVEHQDGRKPEGNTANRTVEQVDRGWARVSKTSKWIKPKPECTPLPEEKKETRKLLSFTTEDGYELYDGDEIYWWHISSKTHGWDGKPHKVCETNGRHIGETWKIFKHKANAEEWIKEQNQVKQGTTDVAPDGTTCIVYQVGEQIELLGTGCRMHACSMSIGDTAEVVAIGSYEGKTATQVLTLSKYGKVINSPGGVKRVNVPQQPPAPATNIGRKVRIKGYKIWHHYEGQVGIVTDDKQGGGDSRALTVKMADGRELIPYKPGESEAQCEWLEEEEYIVKTTINNQLKQKSNEKHSKEYTGTAIVCRHTEYVRSTEKRSGTPVYSGGCMGRVTAGYKGNCKNHKPVKEGQRNYVTKYTHQLGNAVCERC